MFKEYVSDIASQMGIILSEVILTESRHSGCLGTYLLKLASGGHVVGTLILQSELNDIQNSYLLELKIKSSLERLMVLTTP